MTRIERVEMEITLLEKKLETLNETLKILETDKGVEEPILVGSRVRITFQNGNIIDGRVWRIKDDGYAAVNRDGYKKEILVRISELQNLSVGINGRIERQYWLTENKIEKLKEQLTFLLNL